MAAYFDRGWCFTEASWASLTKNGSLSLDLGLMRDGVKYDCDSLIDDCVQAGRRGKEAAAPRLKELGLSGNQIGDEGCKALAAAFKEGGSPSLKARDAPSPLAPSRPMLIVPPNACRSWSTRGQQEAA